MSSNAGDGDKPVSKYLHKFFPDGVVPNFLEEIAGEDAASGSSANTATQQKGSQMDEDKFSNPGGFFRSQHPSPSPRALKVSEPAAKTVHVPKRELTADSKMVQNEWAWKFRMAHEAQVQALKKGVKLSSLYAEESSSESKKAFWGKAKNENADKQVNDPWYTNDVWGEDFTDDILQQVNLDSLTANSTQPLTQMPEAPNEAPKSAQHRKKDDLFMSILKDEEDGFLNCLEILASQECSKKPEIQTAPKPGTSGASSKPSSSQLSLSKAKSKKMVSTQIPTKQINVKQSSVFPLFPEASKDLESKVTSSQRKLEKPTKSLPTINSQAHTTEWLRSKLEKINKEYESLKRNAQIKEGETKLLREKLKSAQAEIERQKLDKVKGLDDVKKGFEAKIKKLERDLDISKTQMLFKVKESEAVNFGEFKSLSKIDETEIVLNEDNTEKLEIDLETNEEEYEVEPYFETEDYRRLITQIQTGEISGKALDVYGLLHGDQWEDFMKGKLRKKSKSETADDVSQDILNAMDGMKFDETDGNVCQPNDYNIGEKLGSFLTSELNKMPPVEFNHFTLPRVNYVPSILTHADLSDKLMENYHFRRPTLVDLWDTNYNEFGPVKLTEYEKTEIGKPVEPDISKVILGKSRFFSTLEPIRMNLLLLQKAPLWDEKEFSLAKEIVELITEMARELYATLGDVRYRKEEYTLINREPEVIEQCYDTSELDDSFYPFSPEKWKNECYVELRRGVALVGALCACNSNLTRFVLQPKNFKLKRAFVKPEKPPKEEKPTPAHFADLERALNNSFRVDLDESYILQTQQISHKPQHVIQSQDSVEYTEWAKSSLRERTEFNFGVMMAKAKLIDNESEPLVVEKVPKRTLPFLKTVPEINELRVKLFHEGAYSLDKELELVANLNEIGSKNQEGKMGNIQKSRVFSLNKKSDPAPHQRSNLHKEIITKDRSEIIKIANTNFEPKGNNLEKNIWPFDACISEFERMTMSNISSNIGHITSKIKIYRPEDIPDTIDYSSLCIKERNQIPQDDLKKDRKRKCEEMMETLRTKKVELGVLGESLEASVSKNVDIQLFPEGRGKRMLQNVPSTSAQDQEAMELEKEHETTPLEDKDTEEIVVPCNPVSNEPAHKNRVKTFEDDPTKGIEIDANILKMLKDEYSKRKFMTPDEEDAVKFRLHDECENRDDKAEYEYGPTDYRERLKLMDTPRPDIEYISDLVENWSKKMKNAGLLELLCEICKDAGTMRFTPRLNALMISIIIMLQYMVQYQKEECEPHLNKIVTVVREVLYTRPSPMVVCHVNCFLTRAVAMKGFCKMLCHNADQRTFCADEDNKSWVRGSCLMEVLCLIVDTTVDEKSNWNTCVHLSRWSYHVFCMDDAGKTWCDQESGGERRCTCLTALINTSLSIFFRAVQEYRALTFLNEGEKSKELTLKEVVMQALYVLHFLVENDKLFPSHIKSRMYMFAQFVQLVEAMHQNTLSQIDFTLSPNEVDMLRTMLRQDFIRQFVNPKPTGSPSFTNLFAKESWMSHMMDVDQLFAPDQILPEDDW